MKHSDKRQPKHNSENMVLLPEDKADHIISAAGTIEGSWMPLNPRTGAVYHYISGEVQIGIRGRWIGGPGQLSVGLSGNLTRSVDGLPYMCLLFHWTTSYGQIIVQQATGDEYEFVTGPNQFDNAGPWITLALLPNDQKENWPKHRADPVYPTEFRVTGV